MSTITVYEELEQRSDEWYAARLGLVTASTIGRLITVSAPPASAYDCPECPATAGEGCKSLRAPHAPIKTTHGPRIDLASAAAATAPPVIGVAGDRDRDAHNLMLTLAAERISGDVEDTPMTSDMWRGVESEPFARDAYAEHTGTQVTEVGFIIRHEDAYSVGYSPDGLVGEDGLIEIKSPRAKGHVATALEGEVPAHYMAQIQCGLWVTGRKWCDFLSFHGGMALLPIRVTPDPDWQTALHLAALTAETTIRDLVTRYEAATKGLPIAPKILDLDELVI